MSLLPTDPLRADPDPNANVGALVPSSHALAASPLRRRQLLVGGGAAALAAALPGRARAAEPKIVTVARGLQYPWGLAFLPGTTPTALGPMLVTERRGHLQWVDPDGTVHQVQGVPAVAARGQGGLLDVALDPDFAREPWVYLSYSEAGDGGAGTAVARGRLTGQGAQARLEDVQVIFRQLPKSSGGNHFGSRLVFGRDGRLFVTLGDRFSHRDQAQTLDNHFGKVVRLERDGRIPADNPFVGRVGAREDIWSYGHRNIQGAALHPQTGELWTHEHGPQGGDEVNVTLAARNYGWPVVTFGREYGIGTRIGEATERDGIEKAVTTWVPSIAPSGMAFVTSSRYPGWQGNLLVGALRGQLLARLELDGQKVVREERLLTRRFERLRDVRQGPDGWIYLLTDNSDGRILRLEV